MLERFSYSTTGARLRNPRRNLPRLAFSDRDSAARLGIYRCRALFGMPSAPSGQQKAFASLDRGPGYPEIYAMSGYFHPGRLIVINNELRTRKAGELRRTFDLLPKICAASHVEPQLLAYLVDRHSLHLFDDGERNSRNHKGNWKILNVCNP